MDVAISEIIIGKRHRKDMGDIPALAASIEAVGLLHPVVLRPDKKLVVGERRIAAFRYLKRDKIPARTAGNLSELADLLRAEADENTCRLAFAPTEAAAILKAMLPGLKAEAAKAQEEGGKAGASKGGKTAGKGRPKIALSQTLAKGKDAHANRALAIAAATVGMTAPTAAKLLAVVESGDKALATEMDRTRKVNGAYKKLATRKAAAQITAEPPPLPKGPFRVIVADPPWRYNARPEDPSHRAANPYPTMTVEEISALDVKAIANKDAVLWLWVTNAFLPIVWPIIEAWGFQYKTCLTWVKNRMGTGDWLRGQTEHCLMCVRGKPTIVLTNQTTAMHGPMRAHSQKPEEFYALVEALCPGSKVELFSREPRHGWAAHGNEVT